jgi:DNA polymerase elongation subunit (family B)
MGQKIIKHMLYEVLPNHGYEPFYASTDSAMVQCKSDDLWGAWDESQELTEKINKDLDKFIQEEFNPIHNYVTIGCEKIFSQCLLFNKRMYALKTVIEDSKSGPVEIKGGKPYIRGLEYLKNNSAMVTTRVQEDLIEMIMDMASEQEIKDYLRDINDKFESYDWAYISERSSISRDPDEGSDTAQNYNACRNANKFCDKDYMAGSRPLLGLFRHVPSTLNQVSRSELYQNDDGNYPIAFEKWDQEWMEERGFILDYDKHKEIQLIGKIERFIELIWGMTYKEFVEEQGDPFEI